MNTVSSPVRYATVRVVSWNLSRAGRAASASSAASTRHARDTVPAAGCRKPFTRCPTSAKWKFDRKLTTSPP